MNIFIGSAFSSPYQITLIAGYRPQVKTSPINYPYLSSWDGFVDLPFVGARIVMPINGEWCVAGSYRYLFKSARLGGGNEVSLNISAVTVGPYYHSPTTDSRSFFINLSTGIGIGFSGFNMDIGGVTDKLQNTDWAMIATLGFEKRIYNRFSLSGELNYVAMNSTVKGNIGNNSTTLEATLNVSGLDIDLAAGYEFDL